MPRLFVKIFLSFWATVVVIGISLVLAFVLQPAKSRRDGMQRSLTRHGSLGQLLYEPSSEAAPLLRPVIFTRSLGTQISMDVFLTDGQCAGWRVLRGTERLAARWFVESFCPRHPGRAGEDCGVC